MKKIFFLSLSFFLFFQSLSIAQTPSDSIAISTSKKTLDSIARQKDIIDVGYKLTKLKILIRKPDSIKMKPGKLLFSGNPAIGYTIQTNITALWTENISFLTGPNNNTNLSTINASPEYSILNHQIIMPLVF
ncbi:MAG: hypothetical protein ACHQHP_01950, partial [Bacteroidia bacterium]